MMYRYLMADGTREELDMTNPLSLEMLQNLVGGNIEFYHPEPYSKKTLCINEDGLSLGLKRNPFYPEVVGDVVEGFDKINPEDTKFVGKEV